MYGKQAELSIPLITGKAYNTAYITQLWEHHERCGLVELTIWKTSKFQEAINDSNSIRPTGLRAATFKYVRGVCKDEGNKIFPISHYSRLKAEEVEILVYKIMES